MGHAEYASKSLAVLMKLAAMLRIVPAMQFVLDKLAALLRGKGSDELLADEFLDEASCITRSAVVQRAPDTTIQRARDCSDENERARQRTANSPTLARDRNQNVEP
jgi:hypothetical protein